MRTDLPGGEVTLVLTDIEGSTRLLRELGSDDYARALAEHRRVIRAAFGARRGVEVDTQGDAFFIAFTSASDAIDAAQQMTDGLATGPIRIRIGIHSGRPSLTEEGYVGEDVHLAARVAAAAHGGQVVVTDATRRQLDEPRGLRELGEHRLKDITDPVALFQLGDAAFPPLRTISSTNLPRPPSSFVGRREDVDAIIDRMHSGARLVTLTGPGGTGKTRLAIETATVMLPEFAGGVFWIPLASLRDPALVLPTVGQTLGAKVELAAHIGQREMLLVLDNFEQVIEAAPAVADLLTACPGLKILMTSRELLRVQGEVEVRVPALPPDEAVALFGQRSGLPTSPAIAQLCARLDHLPLAIELAAARSRSLSPGQILERLAQRLDLLKGGRDAAPRQQTLRATLEWSYDLLATDEQALFRRLAVFAGGATLEAAESIVDADLDVLQSLVEKSLVNVVADRYRMLETIREYAAELLAAAPDADGIRERHARWIADLVVRAESRLEEVDQDVWLDRLVQEHDDIRAALRWSIEQAKVELALTIAGAVATFWWIKGHWAEGRRWLSSALSLPGSSPDAIRARALEGAANLDVRLGDYVDATPLAEESLAISRRLADDRGVARALRVVGLIAWGQGDLVTVRDNMERSATAARAAGDRWALSMALNNLGYLALDEGDFSTAAGRFDEAVDLARIRGDLRSVAFFLENLALARLGQHDVEGARGNFASSLRIAHRLGFLEVVATDLIGAAALATKSDPDRAARLMGAAEQIIGQTGGGLDSAEQRLRDETATAITHRIGAGSFEMGLEIGRSSELDDIVELAIDALVGPGEGAGDRRERDR
jgi:predicted ATPase/class 3 adenylate cyclase